MTRLNLGCGSDKRPGWLNTDKFAACKPDVVMDLEKFPWPLEDDSADEVLLKHVLEHVGQNPDVFLKIIQELYRVCRNGATVTVIVPHPRHSDFLADPTHVRPILPETLAHFSLAINQAWQARQLPGTPLAVYLEVDFQLGQTEVKLEEPWLSDFSHGRITQAQLEHALKSSNNVASELTITLQAVKPFPSP